MEITEISAIERGVLEDYWADHVFAVQHHLDVDERVMRHYHVRLDGRHTFQADGVLLSGVLLSTWQPCFQQPPDMTKNKVVVRLSYSHWFAVAKHTSSLRLLHCPLLGKSEPPVLDATTGPSVVAAGIPVRTDECVQVAELFSGGFLGWGQAVSVLHHHHVPVRLRWALDMNPVCGRSFAAQHDAAHIVTFETSTEEHLRSQCPAFLNASILEDWWLAWPARQAADIWCSSPPCQPWSAAGSQQGLHDCDGKLVLRLLSLVQTFQPEILCVEEVAGFRRHPHFPFVKQCWEEAGYAELWHQVLDLIDFAPQSRKRSLIVLVRQDKVADFPRLQGRPVLPKRPTLGGFDCLLQLCPALAKACCLAPETMAMYFDPYYCPPSRTPGRQLDMLAQRVITPQGRTNTIMAQYHRQHLLPEAALARGGILGNLFRDVTGLRFLSGPEVALIHCCCSPLFIPADDAELMTIVGNSLSVPQAVIPLALAVSSLQESGSKVDPHQAVHWVLGDRIRASQVSLLPLRDGWVLCRGDQVQEAMHRLRPAAPWGQLPLGAPMTMQLFWVQDDYDTVAFLKTRGIPLTHLLDSLGVQYDEYNLQEMQLLEVNGPIGPQCVDNPVAAAMLATTSLPEIRVAGLPVCHDLENGPNILIVLGAQAVYALADQGPTVAEALHTVAHIDGLQPPEDKALWQCSDGVPLHSWEDFRSTIVLVHDDAALPISLPDCSAASLLHVRFLSYVDPPRLFWPETEALQIGAGFPMQHLTNMGWFPRLMPAKSNGQQGISVVFQPQPNKLRLRQEDIAVFCAGTLFQGCLNARQFQTMFQSPGVPVKVQIEGKTVWQGKLADRVTFQDVLGDWKQVRNSLGFLAAARVGSGPRWPEPQVTLQEAMCSSSVPKFISRTGHLLVTIYPEVRGGGAKDEKYTSCQTQLAREFLEHGVSLSDASAIVDRLMPQAGLARVQRAVALMNPDNRWQQLLQLCQQFHVAVPPTGRRLQQAQQRVMAKAKARAQVQKQAVKASSFRLQENYFFNADGTQANLLSQLQPGCSGIILMDAEEAAPNLGIRTMDELGILVLGHVCPQPETCAGQFTVPAVNSLSEPVLLKACMHQLGDRKITMRCKHAAEVNTEDAICCAFSVYQDEWTEAEWGLLKVNPVRTVLDIWRKGGIETPFTSPWGRSFKEHADPSSRNSCATLQFHARVSLPLLSSLLPKSGYNKVYVTPKTWLGEILSGWAIVWVPAAKDEVSTAAMGLQEQCGLVRSKMRLGVRVPEAMFPTAFQRLRPGITLPARLDIRETFRLSGLPPGLRSEDIAAWGQAVKWPLRPLRPLGPRQWIVGATAPPPDGHLSFNDQPVLVQRMPGKAASQPVVCAGRVPPPPDIKAPGNEDPWIQTDPWKQYLQKLRPGEASTGPASRQLAAPTEEKFKEQDLRFQQIEATLKEVQQGQSSIAADHQKFRQEVQAEVSTVRSDLGKFSAEIDRQMKANVEAMQSAHLLQQQQMNAGFSELKALLEQQQRPQRQVKREAQHPAQEPGGMNDL